MGQPSGTETQALSHVPAVRGIFRYMESPNVRSLPYFTDEETEGENKSTLPEKHTSVKGSSIAQGF